MTDMTIDTHAQFIDTNDFDIFSQLDDMVVETKVVEDDMGDFIDGSIGDNTPTDDVDDFDTSDMEDIEVEDEFNYEDIDDENTEEEDTEDEMDGLEKDEVEEVEQPLDLDTVQSETQVMFNGEVCTIGDVIARAKAIPEDQYKELQTMNAQAQGFYESSVRANVKATIENDEMTKVATLKLQNAINTGNGLAARQAQDELNNCKRKDAYLNQRTDEVMGITGAIKQHKVEAFKKQATSVFGVNTDSVLQSTGAWLEQECGVADSMALLEHGSVKLLSKVRKLMAMETQQTHLGKTKKGASSKKGSASFNSTTPNTKSKAAKKAASGDFTGDDVFNSLED